MIYAILGLIVVYICIFFYFGDEPAKIRKIKNNKKWMQLPKINKQD